MLAANNFLENWERKFSQDCHGISSYKWPHKTDPAPSLVPAKSIDILPPMLASLFQWCPHTDGAISFGLSHLCRSVLGALIGRIHYR